MFERRCRRHKTFVVGLHSWVVVGGRGGLHSHLSVGGEFENHNRDYLEYDDSK